jgi:hypothetical protein
MRFTVDYNKDTGELRDANGFLLNIGPGLEIASFEDEKKESTSNLVKLKDAGFTADEIMQMKREGLV